MLNHKNHESYVINLINEFKLKIYVNLLEDKNEFHSNLNIKYSELKL